MWQEPKVDWRAEDSFDIEDYQRIVGNIAVVKQLAEELYRTISLAPAVECKAGGIIFIEFFATVEDNLEKLWRGSIARTSYSKRVMQEGGSVWDKQDLARIEGTLGQLRSDLLAQREAQQIMPFILGGGTVEL